MLITDPSKLSTYEQRLIMENTRNRENRCLVHGGPVALAEMIAYRLIYRHGETRPGNVSTTVAICVPCWDAGRAGNAAWAAEKGVTIHAIDGRDLYA